MTIRREQRIELAKRLIEKYKPVCLIHEGVRGETKSIFYYYEAEGIWKSMEALISDKVRESFVADNNDADIHEVLSYIRDVTYTERGEFENKDPNLIPLNNGVFDLNTKTLRPFKPEDHFFSKLPVDYKPWATCPAITKFLEEVVSLKNTRTLKEFAGYCLYRKYPLHKALMLLGEGANGKSTFINLLKKLLGAANCSSRSLYEINNNRFAKASLYHKLANLYADLPNESLTQTGSFKMLTGGDMIGAEEKYKSPFTFENYAKLIFSANKLPATIDDTNAYFRRWLIVEFPNKFEGESADKNLLDKLTTPEELSGFLNLALEGLSGILQAGRFTHDEATEDIRRNYLRRSDSVHAFVMDRLEMDIDSSVQKGIIYREYANYCREELRLQPVDNGVFSKQIKVFMPNLDERRHKDTEGRRIPYWHGVKLKMKESQIEPEDGEGGEGGHGDISQKILKYMNGKGMEKPSTPSTPSTPATTDPQKEPENKPNSEPDIRGANGYYHCPYSGCEVKTATKKDLEAHTDSHQDPRY